MHPTHRLGRYPGSRPAAPVFRRRIARVRAHQSPPRRLILVSPRQHSCARQRAQGTLLAFGEADGCGAKTLVCLQGQFWRQNCSSMRDVSHGPFRVRIHPGEVCSRGEQTLSVHNAIASSSRLLETDPQAASACPATVVRIAGTFLLRNATICSGTGRLTLALVRSDP
jgi:hypothetical protein